MRKFKNRLFYLALQIFCTWLDNIFEESCAYCFPDHSTWKWTNLLDRPTLRRKWLKSKLLFCRAEEGPPTLRVPAGCLRWIRFPFLRMESKSRPRKTAAKLWWWLRSQRQLPVDFLYVLTICKLQQMGNLSEKTQAPKSINSNHFNKSKQKQNLKRIVIFRTTFPTIPRNQTKNKFQMKCCYLPLQHSNHSIKSVLLGIDQASPVAIHWRNVSLSEKNQISIRT